MIDLLSKLEPRFEKRGTILIDELNELHEVIFVQSGTIYYGYEINKSKNYCIKYQHGCVIGAYGCTFSQRSNYIVYAQTNIEGFFVRKENWMALLQRDEVIRNSLERKILMEQLIKLNPRIELDKKRKIIKLLERKDHQSLLALQPKEESSMHALLI